MTKMLGFLVILATLSACSMTQIVAQEGNRVKICGGGASARRSDANAYCGSQSVTLISNRAYSNISSANAYDDGLGGRGFNFGRSETWCGVFECGGGSSAPAESAEEYVPESSPSDQ